MTRLGTSAVTYDYQDEDGTLLFQVVRTAEKEFRVRRPSGSGGYDWSLGSVARVLYNLPEIRRSIADAQGPIFVVEGEKDVDRMRAEGLVATTCPSGAGKWQSIHTEALAGAVEIVVLPDNDERGRSHSAEVAAALTSIGVAAKVVEIPDLPEKGDVSDFFDRGGTVEELLNLATNAPLWRRDSSSSDDSWPDPDTLGTPSPAAIPLHALPPILREFVTTVCESTQTPADMCSLLALAAVSVTVQGKAEILVRDEWRETLNVYTAVVLPPASRKSPVYKLVCAPLEAFEREQAEASTGVRQTAIDVKEVKEQRLKGLKTRAAKDNATLDEVEAARLDLDRHRVPTLPRLNAPGATPEALARIMAENGGRIAILSPEGDSLGLFCGRYSTNGEGLFELLKKAWTGEMVRTDRIGREGEFIHHPTLTIGICLQPGVLENLNNARAFRAEGVLGRFLLVAPESRIGHRLTGRDVPALQQRVVGRFHLHLRRLLSLEPAETGEDGSYRPHELELTTGALDRLHRFEAEVEAELGPGGRLAHIGDWGGKLVGQTIRIAGLLHVCMSPDRRLDPWAPIAQGTMRDAIRIARALSTHALALFDDFTGTPETKLAKHVLKRASEMGSGLSVHDLHESVRGTQGLKGVREVEEVLDRLEEGHHLRRHRPQRGGPGRPASPTIELHPAHRTARSRTNARARGAAAELTDIADGPDETCLDSLAPPEEPPF